MRLAFLVDEKRSVANPTECNVHLHYEVLLSCSCVMRSTGNCFGTNSYIYGTTSYAISNLERLPHFYSKTQGLWVVDISTRSIVILYLDLKNEFAFDCGVGMKNDRTHHAHAAMHAVHAFNACMHSCSGTCARITLLEQSINK